MPPVAAGTRVSGATGALCAILTRPDGQADGFARALNIEGIDTLAFPLLHIAAQTDAAALSALDRALRSLPSYALTVFVSPNAVAHALARFVHLHSRDNRDTADARAGDLWPRALPVAVVGPGSAQALAEAGIAPPQGGWERVASVSASTVARIAQGEFIPWLGRGRIIARRVGAALRRHEGAIDEMPDARALKRFDRCLHDAPPRSQSCGMPAQG